MRISSLLALLILVAGCSNSARNAPASDYLLAMVRSEPWAESTWKDYPAIPGAGYFGDGASEGNGGIRGSCGVALSYAVLVREFPDALERPRRLQRVEAALRYAAETHSSNPKKVVAVDGKQWGVFPGMAKFDAHGWQSPLWAATMGLAAALVEKELDPAVVAGCKRVVAAESDVLVTIPPASGFKRDSKCEENAWDSSIPALAAAWMPDDPRAAKWVETAKKYLVNTYTVADTADDPLRDWVTTQTLFPSFAIENHGFYHPMYHIDGGNSMGDTYLMARLINPAVAEEIRPFAEHNVVRVWQILKGIVLDTGEIAYPSGVDWSLHSFEHVNYLAYMATHFNEPQAQWAEPRLAKAILARQAANGDGRFVGESTPNGFYREAVESRHLAIAFLHHQVNGFPNKAGKPPEDQLAHYEDVGLIVHRTKHALVTISYGARTMALIYPLGGDNLARQFMISPNESSLIGPAGKTSLKEFAKTEYGFRAVLSLDSRGGRKSTMEIQSTGGGLVALEEMPAEGASLPRGEWYLVAIENHAFTGGQRTIQWEGTRTVNSRIIKERSGVTQTISTNWIFVDDWLGILVRTEGQIEYRAAKTYNRNGAAEDTIIFRPIDPAAPRSVLVFTKGIRKQATTQAPN